MKSRYENLPSFMNSNSKYRSIVLRIAHNIKKEDGFDFGTAQSKAWDVARLLENLYNDGFASFTFAKVSTGEIRKAKGTRNLKIIPIKKHPKKKSENPTINIKAIPYFDANKNEWRSFKPHTLLSNAS